MRIKIIVHRQYSWQIRLAVMAINYPWLIIINCIYYIYLESRLIVSPLKYICPDEIAAYGKYLPDTHEIYAKCLNNGIAVEAHEAVQFLCWSGPILIFTPIFAWLCTKPVVVRALERLAYELAIWAGTVLYLHLAVYVKASPGRLIAIGWAMIFCRWGSTRAATIFYSAVVKLIRNTSTSLACRS